MRKTYVLIAVVIMILMSCGNDDTNDSNFNELEVNEANLIGTWKLEGLTLNGSFVDYNPCDQALLTILSKDEQERNLALFIFGANDVDPSCVEYTSADYIWSLNSDDVLMFAFGFDQRTQKIIELTTSTLKLEDRYIESGEEFVDVEIYSKQ